MIEAKYFAKVLDVTCNGAIVHSHQPKRNRTMNHDFLTESDARKFWHLLLDDMGFDALLRRCKIAVIKTEGGSFFRVSVSV